MAHSVHLTRTHGGWDVATCECGWESGPCDGRDAAADAYGDHRAAQAVTVTANVDPQGL